jgi:glycosyltransferase involved in cell wall biosynthesis
MHLNVINTSSSRLSTAQVNPEPNQDAHHLKPSSGLKLSEPLLSFVLVNWNYARYVGETIDSIRGQDYRNFECVVIDNGSDDDSLTEIRKNIGDDSRFRLIELSENMGQLGAAFIGIRETTGPFVALIDSDDVLFPSFASVHIQAHLALPHNVGFTSSNVLEIDGNGGCISSGMPFGEDGRNDGIVGLRQEVAVPRIDTVSSDFYNSILHGRTQRLSPSELGWLWFPGTSNVFRRSVLDLLVPTENQLRMRASDTYFLPISHAFAGSALINFPLSAYRVHGDNYYAVRESLSA